MIPECLITSNVNLNHLIQWRSLTDHLKVILFLLCLLTSIHQWFLLVLVFTSVCIMIFLISSFLLHLLIGIILKELSHLFIIYSFIQSLIPVGTRDIHFRNHRMVKHCSKFLYPASKDYFYYYYCYIGPCYGTTKCMYTSMQLSLYCQEEYIDSE